MLVKGKYQTTAPSLSVNGVYEYLQVDSSGNLAVTSRPHVVVNGTDLAGAASTYGKIGTVANAAAIYVLADCTGFPANYVDWVVKSDQQFTYQFFRAHANPLAATITLSDATAVDADDTFVLNSLTYTAKTSGAVAASRQYNLGADNAAAAVNLATLLQGAYGVPGITASDSVPGTGNDVITLSATDATTLQFGQGTSASNEIAFADTTLLNLYLQAAASSNQAATSTMAGQIIQQAVNGWEYAVLKYTNTSGSTAATVVIEANIY